MEQGTGTPKVTVSVATGNLLRQVQVLDGVAGLVGTSVTKIGEVVTVNSYDDAVEKGYTAVAEPFLNEAIQLFYEEIGGSIPLSILGVEDTMTLTQMVTSTNANGLKKLLKAKLGTLTNVALIRKPSVAYAMTANHFLDQDVEAALLASKTLGLYQQTINKPVRMFIEGRVNDMSANLFEPKSASNGFAGVVLGNNTDDGTSSAGLTAIALARAVKFAAHVKIGNGQNGPLTIPEAFIGDKPIDEFDPTELDAFSNAGYIIPHRRDGLAGFYFGRDRMATDDDFRILVHGQVVDKAHRIVISTLTPLLETEVRMTDEGFINPNDAVDLEEKTKQTIRASMSGQISNVDFKIATNQDIINTGTDAMELKVLPLGYRTWIKVKIGLTANL